jgi:hypothetical protein
MKDILGIAALISVMSSGRKTETYKGRSIDSYMNKQTGQWVARTTNRYIAWKDRSKEGPYKNGPDGPVELPIYEVGDGRSFSPNSRRQAVKAIKKMIDNEPKVIALTLEEAIEKTPEYYKVYQCDECGYFKCAEEFQVNSKIYCKCSQKIREKSI